MALRKIKNLTTKWTNPSLSSIINNQRISYPKSISPQLLRYFFVKRFKDDLDALFELGVFFEERSSLGYNDVQDYIYHAKDYQVQLGIYGECSRLNTLQESITNNSLQELGWETLDTAAMPVGYFISQTNPSSAVVLRNVENRCTLIFLREPLTPEIQARIFAVLYLLMPWVFDKPTDEEKEFFKLLSNLATDKVAKIMDDYYDSIDIRQLLFSKTLNGFENCVRDEQIRKMENEMSSLLEDIKAYEQSLNQVSIRRTNVAFSLKQLRLAARDESNAMASFMISHANIDNVRKMDRQKLYYSIIESIDFFDEEEFKTFYESPNSYFYKEKQFAQELYEIFINHRGKFIVKSEFCLDSLSSLSPIRKDSANSDSEFDDLLPHPHLCWYGCLGGNAAQINQALQDGNWDLAIDQSIGATKNVNFSDSTVMSRLLSYLRETRSSSKYILADNGVRMTLDEFSKYLKEEKKDGEIN